ncbi:major facilitator superfamily domain-containing protein [Cladochytrium replicatum]|nr:major facilitator superfamily domain-containing protein [Cladochytrium replicatum]
MSKADIEVTNAAATATDAAAAAAVSASRKRTRALQVALCAILDVITGVMSVGFAPVPQQTADFFTTSLSGINYMAIVYTFMFIPGAIFSSKVLDDHGPRASLIIGAVLQVIGSLAKYLATLAPAPASLGIAYVGQVFNGLGQPFVLNAPTKIAGIWFGSHERGLPNAIMSVCNSFGSFVGYLIGPLIVTTVADIPTYALVQTIMMAVVTIPTIFFARNPPELAERFAFKKEKDPAKRNNWGLTLLDVRILFSVPEYAKMTICFTVAIGLFTAMGTLLTQFILAYGYTEIDGSICAALLIVIGTISAGLSGWFIDRTFKHLLVLKSGYTSTVLMYAFFAIVACIPGIMPAVAISCALLGIASFIMLPAALELGAAVGKLDVKEVVIKHRERFESKTPNEHQKLQLDAIAEHGMEEGVTSGVMWLLAQGMSMILILVLDAINSSNADRRIGVRASVWTMTAVSAIGCVVIWLFPSAKGMERVRAGMLELKGEEKSSA